MADNARKSTGSQKWLDETANSVDSDIYSRHQKAIFEDPVPESIVWLAVISALGTFVAVCAAGGPLVESIDNGLLTVAFSFVALALAFVAFAGISVGHAWLTDRSRANDPSRQVWSRDINHPIAASARQAAVLASVVSEEIRQSPAWLSLSSQTVRGRLDLYATVVDVMNRAARIDSALATLPDGATRNSPLIRSAAENNLQAAAAALKALADQVAALYEYRARLRPIEKLLVKKAKIERDMEIAGQIDALDSSKFDALYKDAGISEWHATDIRDHSKEIIDVEAALRYQVSALGELTTNGQLPHST